METPVNSSSSTTESTPMEPLQQIQALEAQIAQLREKAHTDALAKVQAALTSLNALGYNYSITEKGGKKATKTARPVKDTECPVCNFKTVPPHDRRAHRHMEDPAKPFTKKQLDEKGLVKA